MRRSELLVYTFCIVASALVDGEEFLLETFDSIKLYHFGVKSNYKDLMTFHDPIHSLDYHFSNNLVFTTSNNKLYKSTLDTNRSAEVDVVNKHLVKDLTDCKEFAVDWVHDRIYAAIRSSSALNILGFGLNGGDERTLVTLARSSWPSVKEMEIDPYEGILFWIEHDVIQSVNTSGKGLNPRLTKAEITVEWLALDMWGRRVFYVGGVSDSYSLYSMDYAGGDMVKHASMPQLRKVRGLSILRNKLFWVNFDTGENVLLEAPLNLTGQNDVKTLATITSTYLYDLKVLDRSLQERPVRDPCLNKGCAHSCVATGETTAECKCPPDQTLHRDGVSCHGKCSDPGTHLQERPVRDPCLNKGCAHSCVATGETTAECKCPPDQTLHGDGVSCHAIEECFCNRIIFLVILLVLVGVLASFIVTKVLTKKPLRPHSFVELQSS